MANMGARHGGGGTGWKPPPGGPGKWVQVKESMKPPARKYQSQVTGAPEGWAYRIDDVDFDGFDGGALQEAKGPGYAHFFDAELTPLEFFEGAKGLLRQAQRQLMASRGTPVRWYVAERKFADALRKMFYDNGLDAIEVEHLPPSRETELQMLETYYAGAYWLNRQESAADCARRAETLFRLLARCDPSLTRWFQQGRTRKEALSRPIQPDAATFEALFSKKENQPGADGFDLWVWDGEPQGFGTGVNFNCGSASRFVCNTCLLRPPKKGPASERVLSAPVLTEVLRSMALAWEPEWAIATSSAHRDDVLKNAKAGTFVGWLMYFSHQRGAVPPLPAPVRVEPVEDKGTLVILTPERFTATNPEHVALAAHVHALLDQARLLHPLKP